MPDKKYKTPNGQIVSEKELQTKYGEKFNSLIQNKTFSEVNEPVYKTPNGKFEAESVLVKKYGDKFNELKTNNTFVLDTPVVKKKAPTEIGTSTSTSQNQKSVSGKVDGSLVTPKMQAFNGFSERDLDNLNNLPKQKSVIPQLPKNLKKVIDNPENYVGKVPKKETRGFGGEVLAKLAKGSSQLGADIASIPELVYDVFAIPQNAIADIFDAPSLKTDSKKFEETTGVKNQVKEFYKNEVSKLKQESDLVDKKYQFDVTDSFINGDYANGFRQLTNSFAESLPATTSIMVGGAYVQAPKLLLASTMMFGAGKNEELKDQNPEMNTNTRVANALASGLAEGAFETIGSGTIGASARALVEREGKQKAFSIMKDGLQNFYKESLKKNPLTASATGEGVEEWATQVTQNAIDVATGVKPSDYNIFTGGADAFIGGAFGGAVFGAGLKGLDKIVTSKDNDKVKANLKASFALQEQLENPEISPIVKAEIEKKINTLVSENQKIINNAVDKSNGLDDDSKKKLSDSIDKIAEIKTKAEEIKADLSTPNSVKQVLLDELKKEYTEANETKKSIIDAETQIPTTETKVESKTEVQEQTESKKVIIPDELKDSQSRAFAGHQENITDLEKRLAEEKALPWIKRSKSEIKWIEDSIKFHKDNSKLLEENPIQYYKNWLNSEKETHENSLKENFKDENGKTYKDLMIERFGTTDFETTNARLIEDLNGRISKLEEANKPQAEIQETEQEDLVDKIKRERENKALLNEKLTKEGLDSIENYESIINTISLAEQEPTSFIINKIAEKLNIPLPKESGNKFIRSISLSGGIEYKNVDEWLKNAKSLAQEKLSKANKIKNETASPSNIVTNGNISIGNEPMGEMGVEQKPTTEIVTEEKVQSANDIKPTKGKTKITQEPTLEDISNFLNENFKPNEANNPTKAESVQENSALGKGQKPKKPSQRGKTPLDKRKIKDKDVISALRTEVFDPYSLTQQYFISGGRVLPSEVKKLFNSDSEAKVRIGFTRTAQNKGATIDGIANYLWEQYGENLGLNTEDFRNAVEQVISDFVSTKSMAVDLNNRNKINFEENVIDESEFYAEAKAMDLVNENDHKEALSYFDVLTDEELIQLADEQTSFEEFLATEENKQSISEKQQRKNKANAEVDKIADKIKDLLPGINDPDLNKQGFSQDQLIDLIANAVKNLISAGIEIDEAIRQVSASIKERFNIDVNIDDVKAKLEPKKETIEREVFVAEKGKHSVILRLSKGDNAEREIEAINKADFNYEVRNQDKVNRDVENFIKDVGIAQAYKAVKEGKIEKFDTVALIYNAILQQMPIEHEKLISEMTSEEDILRAEESYVNEFSQVSKEFSVLLTNLGQGVSVMNYIYNKNENIKYSLEQQKNVYKSKNNGVIPKDVEEKYQKASKHLEEVNELIKKKEAELSELENTVLVEEIEKSIKRQKESTTKAKAPLTESEQKRKKQLSRKFFGQLNDITRFAVIIADPEFREYLGLSFKEVKGDLTNFTNKIVSEIGSGARKFIDEMFNIAKEENEISQANSIKINNNGKVRIPKSIIESLIEKGFKDINSISQEVFNLLKEKHPELSLRQIKESIVGYGRDVAKTRPDIDIEIGRLRRVGQLELEIEDLENGIKKAKTERKQIEQSAKIIDLKAKKRQLEDQLGITEENRTERTKQYTKRRIIELKERIAKGDFSKKEIKPVKQDAELRSLRAEKLELQEIFSKEQYKLELKNRSSAKKIFDSVFDILNIKRVGLTTGEFSPMFVQGGALTVRNILRNPKQFLSDFRNMFKAMASTKYYKQTEQDIKSSDIFDIIRDAKLGIVETDTKQTAKEELFQHQILESVFDLGAEQVGKLIKSQLTEKYGEKRASEIAENVERITKEYVLILRPFERANNVYMNSLRYNRFKEGVKMLEAQGKNPIDNLEDYKRVASAINTLTGRSNLGALEQYKQGLGLIFFSAKLMASTWQKVNPMHYWALRDSENWKKPSVAQKMLFVDALTHYAFMASITLLMKAVYNAVSDDEDEEATVEIDPRSSDFMKFKLGNVRLDFFGTGLAPFVLFSRLYTEEVMKADGEIYKMGKSNTKSRGDYLGKYFVNKLNPLTSGVYQELNSTEKEYEGKTFREDDWGTDFSFKKYMTDVMPIIYGTGVEVMEEQPNLFGSLIMIQAAFGVNPSVYGNDDKGVKDRPDVDENGNKTVKSEKFSYPKTPSLPKPPSIGR